MRTENQYFIKDNPQKFSFRLWVRGLFHPAKALFYRLAIALTKKEPIQAKKHTISIVAIFKNEARYLREWVVFHEIIGIDHFYLYNNRSDDDFLAVLQPFIDQGVVTLIDWPKNQAQMECYLDAIKRFRSETNWMGFIDIDEFIVPKETDNIGDFLKRFQSYPSVLLYWKMFGTSGLTQRDDKRLVTEDFTVCWPKYSDIGKCFYNTRFSFREDVVKKHLIHHSFYAYCAHIYIPPVNFCGHFVFEGRNRLNHRINPTDFPIQINHYFTKSLNEYLLKASKGDVYFKDNPHNMEYFYFHEMKCSATDHSAYKYLARLKEGLRE